jgi:group I intron endonuclease
MVFMSSTLSASGIYQIVNLSNGKMYIGSTKCFKERFYGHKLELNNNNHSNSYLQNSWNKYGEHNFKFEIIELVSNLNLLQEREQFWLDKTKSFERLIGYNILPYAFNSQGYTHSNESKLKMSISNKGNRNSSKISKEDVFSIRLLLRDTDLTKTEIANLFNVNKSNIISISKNQTWKDVVITFNDNLSNEYLQKVKEIKTNRKPKKNSKKLDQENVKTIKLLLRDTKLTQHEISKLFGVSLFCISNIKCNKTWSDVIINSNDDLDFYYLDMSKYIIERR